MPAHHLFDEMSSCHEPVRSCVLYGTVTHLMYPVTEKVLSQIFDVYGVNDVCLLQQPTHLEVYVEFQSWHEATQARDALHGRCIYDGCCLLDIQHAPLSISVIRLPNSESVVVDWDRVEVEPLASSSTPSSSTSAPAAATTTSMGICKVSTEVHADAAYPVDVKALGNEEVVALPTLPHGTSSAATTKVQDTREEVSPAAAGCTATAPTTCSTECLNQAGSPSSDEGVMLSFVWLSPHTPQATELVFCESLQSVFVPARPQKLPDPTQGPSVCNLIPDFTTDILTLVQLETIEWDPGIIKRPFLNNINLDETYEVEFSLVLAIGWYTAYITENTVGSNNAGFENGVFVGIKQETKYEIMLHFFIASAHLQHIVQVVSFLIGSAWCFTRQDTHCVSLPLSWDPGIFLGIIYGHLCGTLISGTVFQHCSKFKFIDCLLAWCSGSSTTMFCLYFQWYSLIFVPCDHLHHKDSDLSNLSAAISLEIYYGQLPISQLCDMVELTYCSPRLQMFTDCQRIKTSEYKMEEQQKFGGVELNSCFPHSPWLPNIILMPGLEKGGHSWEEAQGKCTHKYKFGGVNLSSSMRVYMDVVQLLDNFLKFGCFDAVLARQLGARCCLANQTLEGAPIVQGLQWLDLLMVLEPQGVYWIARMHVVTCVNVLDAHEQWDPGGFLMSMGCENKTNHHERCLQRLQRIGAQGYRLIIGMNDSPTNWDPGIVAIYESAIPVRVEARRTPCRSGSCKLLQPVHAIAWGQAMFCWGGSVTPDIFPVPHLGNGLMTRGRPNTPNLEDRRIKRQEVH